MSIKLIRNQRPPLSLFRPTSDRSSAFMPISIQTMQPTSLSDFVSQSDFQGLQDRITGVGSELISQGSELISELREQVDQKFVSKLSFTALQDLVDDSFGQINSRVNQLNNGLNSTINQIAARFIVDAIEPIKELQDRDLWLDTSLEDKFKYWDDDSQSFKNVFDVFGGLKVADGKLFLGAGNFNNSDTNWYSDSSGNFSLGNKLSWNGTTLNVSGTITVTGGYPWNDISGGNKPENNATVGADWNSDLSNIPGTLGAPSGSGLFLGSTRMGFFDSGTWKTYMDDSGNFFLGGTGGKLTWNAGTSTLTVTGKLVIEAASSGYANISDKPAGLGDINSGEGTKLTGIETEAKKGADVGTGTNKVLITDAVFRVGDPTGVRFENTGASITGRDSGGAIKFIVAATDGAMVSEGLCVFGTIFSIIPASSLVLVQSGNDFNVVSGVYQVAGTQVLGSQGAAVTKPTGGSTIDAESRTSIDTIIDRLNAHGIIA